MITDPSLITAVIYHKRHTPIEHSFDAKVFFLALNLKNLQFFKKLKFFSINRFNVFSLYWKEYGFKEFKNPFEYLQGILKSFEINTDHIKEALLMTMPKCLGYGFNPCSFWLCFNKRNELIVVLAEVNNTFKQRHGYLIYHKNLSAIKSNDIIAREKIFHVSPFFEVLGEYHFNFCIKEKTIRINLNYSKDDVLLFSTSIQGKREKLSNATLLRCFFLYPFMSFCVIFLIHYHAVCLWFKKVPFFSVPKKPKKKIS